MPGTQQGKSATVRDTKTITTGAVPIAVAQDYDERVRDSCLERHRPESRGLTNTSGSRGRDPATDRFVNTFDFALIFFHRMIP